MSTEWSKVSDGTTPHCYIQWKGTDVCVDLYCTCGEHLHFDGWFLYFWKCPKCATTWEMGTAVVMRESNREDEMVQYPEADD